MEAAFEKEWKKIDGRPGECETGKQVLNYSVI